MKEKDKVCHEGNKFYDRFAWFDMSGFIPIVILLMSSCAGVKQKNNKDNIDLFLINNIKSKNDWYIVYAPSPLWVFFTDKGINKENVGEEH